MSDKMGPRTFGDKQEMVFLGREISEQRDYSEKVAQEIDEEVQAIIQHAHDEAKRILTKNKKRLAHLAEKLIAQETIEGDELEAAFTEPLGTRKAEAPAPPAPRAEQAPPEENVKPAPRKRAAPQIVPKQAPPSPQPL